MSSIETRSQNIELAITPELALAGESGLDAIRRQTTPTEVTQNHNHDSSSASGTAQRKPFKTEYKSKFTPFDQYVYNENTDTFVRHSELAPTVTASRSNQNLSAGEALSPRTALASGQEAHVFEPTNSGGCLEQHEEPWYKEVVRRKEQANEYRYKSELGHNSPLLSYPASELEQRAQLCSPASQAAGSDHGYNNNQDDGSSDRTAPSEPEQQARQPQYKFTPNDYKRDHLIAHMANNNNFALPREASASAARPTSRTATVSRSARSRSQSNRRQPPPSSVPARRPEQTKSQHTTPTKLPARTPLVTGSGGGSAHSNTARLRVTPRTAINRSPAPATPATASAGRLRITSARPSPTPKVTNSTTPKQTNGTQAKPASQAIKRNVPASQASARPSTAAATKTTVARTTLRNSSAITPSKLPNGLTSRTTKTNSTSSKPKPAAQQTSPQTRRMSKDTSEAPSSPIKSIKTPKAAAAAAAATIGVAAATATAVAATTTHSPNDENLANEDLMLKTGEHANQPTLFDTQSLEENEADRISTSQIPASDEIAESATNQAEPNIITMDLNADPRCEISLAPGSDEQATGKDENFLNFVHDIESTPVVSEIPSNSHNVQSTEDQLVVEKDQLVVDIDQSLVEEDRPSKGEQRTETYSSEASPELDDYKFLGGDDKLKDDVKEVSPSESEEKFETNLPLAEEQKQTAEIDHSTILDERVFPNDQDILNFTDDQPVVEVGGASNTEQEVIVDKETQDVSSSDSEEDNEADRISTSQIPASDEIAESETNQGEADDFITMDLNADPRYEISLAPGSDEQATGKDENFLNFAHDIESTPVVSDIPSSSHSVQSTEDQLVVEDDEPSKDEQRTETYSSEASPELDDYKFLQGNDKLKYDVKEVSPSESEEKFETNLPLAEEQKQTAEIDHSTILDERVFPNDQDILNFTDDQPVVEVGGASNTEQEVIVKREAKNVSSSESEGEEELKLITVEQKADSGEIMTLELKPDVQADPREGSILNFSHELESASLVVDSEFDLAGGRPAGERVDVVKDDEEEGKEVKEAEKAEQTVQQTLNEEEGK